MRIPLSYNLRNLTVRKTTTIMTALGIALTVAVLLAVLALVSGLHAAFDASGHPLHVLLTRKGATSELTSNFLRTRFQDLKFLEGIATNAQGEPMASLEMVTVIVLESEEGNSQNLNLRGLTPIGMAMREGLQLERGRWFQPGRREVVVGKSIAERYPAAAVGKKLRFGRGDWDIVGVISMGRSSVNSEIWTDLNQVSADYGRTEVLSSALVRARDVSSVQPLIQRIRNDQRLNMDAVTEKAYYAQQTVSALPIQFLGTFVAIIMAVGSSFAAMNTMYAAVSRRSQEIGTLRVLGFSKGGILFSFFLESVLLSLLGGMLGILLVLPLTNLTTAIGSFITFSEMAFQFQVTPGIMAAGLVFSALMGAAGGLFPAATAARKEILTALREV